MKNQTVKIAIANPCHEDWNNMLPEEKGKFCLACQKTVVDFSAMSDAQIIDFLGKSSGKICGRINEERLNTPISNHVPLKSSFFNKYIAGLLMALGFYNTAVQGQNNPKAPQETIIKPGAIDVRKTPKGPMKIEGQITDSKTKKALVYASVTIDGSRITINTDKNGKFSLEVPEEFRNESLTLLISNFGYNDLYLSNIDISRNVVYLNPVLKKEKNMVKGDMMIMGKVAIDPNH